MAAKIPDDEKWPKMTPLLDLARELADKFEMEVVLHVERLKHTGQMNDFEDLYGEDHTVDYGDGTYWGLAVRAPGGRVLKNFVNFVHVEQTGKAD